MPKTSVKTKTKAKTKTHARSPFEPGHGSSKPRMDDSDVEMGESEEEEGKVTKDKKNEKKKEKDDAEKKLERMLFGDDEGFQGALTAQRGHGLSALVAQSDEDLDDDQDEDEGDDDDDDDDKGLEDVADADLFFLDSGAGPVTTDLPEPETPSDEEDDDDDEEQKPAVWHDSDDEQLTVSLADNQRLRKLRVAEAEDVISGTEYIRRLRRQYQQLNPEPAWARPDLNKPDASDMDTDGDNEEGDEDDEEDEVQSTQPLAKLLQNATDLTRAEDTQGPNGKRKLRQEVLDIQRLKDVGKPQPSSIDSLAFHPHYPVLLSSGPAATLFLHHISPSALVPNPLLTSLHLRRTPIHTSSFAPPTGSKILASGRRRYFHIWNLDTGKIDKVNGTADRKDEQKTMERFKPSPCGRYIGLVGSARKGGGVINVLDATTAQWIAQVRVEGRGGVADFAWWSDGNGLTVASKNGEVSEWDARLNRVVARWMDAGAVGTTVIALGGRLSSSRLGGDRWVAVGSSSGVVNIYDRREWSGQGQGQGGEGVPRTPTPVRALDQLTTPISHIVFAPDGQFLVVASRWKRDALRLVHLPSCTVYRNWPTSNTPLGRISAVAVSPGSEHLAVANEQGRIRLWEIRG